MGSGVTKSYYNDNLLSAASDGTASHLEKLVDAGANVNCRNLMNGWTPLHLRAVQATSKLPSGFYKTAPTAPYSTATAKRRKKSRSGTKKKSFLGFSSQTSMTHNTFTHRVYWIPQVRPYKSKL
jgi:hypothetical protein